jgi:hypothetical protein
MSMSKTIMSKYNTFVNEPIGKKIITDIDGVCEKSLNIFNEKGFDYAYQVLAMFLILNKNNDHFDAWLSTEIPSMTTQQRIKCCRCLADWCDKNDYMNTNGYINMEVRTQKGITFCYETMRNKNIIEVDGIGEKASSILKDRGYTYAYQILGQFLLLNCDKKDFDWWIQDNVPSMNSQHRELCYICLKCYCEKFLNV